MLEKPDVEAGLILVRLQDAYGVCAQDILFLPRGADSNTAVYRVVADDRQSYFLKLRRGAFDELSVALPRFLSEQGIGYIIAPLPASTGRLWARMQGWTMVLYPYVDGQNGYEVNFSERNWRDLGAALRSIHAAVLPAALRRRIRREMYSAHWRETVQAFLARRGGAAPQDAVAVEVTAFLAANRPVILDLVGRAERLAQALRLRPPECVLCHSDVHAGNVLIGAGDALYLVDWDDPILAPKERDLMYPGGAQGFRGHTAQEETTLFYQGYGPTEIDPAALAYYRYERIVQDIAVFCEQLLLTQEGGQDRAQSLHYLKSNFLTDNTIETAYRSDRTGGGIPPLAPSGSGSG